MENNTNNTLPASVQEQIEKESLAKYKCKLNGTASHYNHQNACRKGYIAGATEYALKLEQAKKLLERILSRYNEGILPEWTIYNDIKTFLDGSK
jgi:hypothetical protein